MKLKTDIPCPLCKDDEMTYRKERGTHIWACPSCPALMIEYYGKDNVRDLWKSESNNN